MARGRPTRIVKHPWSGALVAVVLAGMLAALITSAHVAFEGFGSGGARGILNAPRFIPSSADGLQCLTAPNYSSDGAHIAVLAVQGQCDASGGAPFGGHVAAIYNAKTGALERTIPLDTLLGTASVQSATARDVRYYNLGFSPDNAFLGVLYTSFDSPDHATLDTLLDQGILLVDLTFGATRVIRGDIGYFSAPGAGLPTWDLAHGSTLPTTPLRPGLAFAWGNNGQPYPIAQAGGPQDPLPVNAGPRYPVGDPGSGSTFTLWQPGLLLGPNSSGTGQPVFASTFPAWSAGDADVTMLALGATLPMPSPLDATNGPRGQPIAVPDTQVAVPARDAALAAVQREIGTAGWALVAWNQEGSLLASINCETQGNPMLEVRDTVSGEVVGSAPLHLGQGDVGCAALANHTDGGAYPNMSYTLQWSPYGTSILYGDVAADSLSQWSVSLGR